MPEVADLVESMATLLPSADRLKDTSISEKPDFHIARKCYDHLAGKVSVEIVRSMVKRGLLIETKTEFMVSDAGRKWFSDFRVDVDELRKERRALARKCLDWSERRNHLAGSLGRALLDQLLTRGWLIPADGRTLRTTLIGRKNFSELFGVVV